MKKKFKELETHTYRYRKLIIDYYLEDGYLRFRISNLDFEYIVKLVKTGGKPIIMGASCWVGITMVSLLLQRIMGIW